MAGRNLLITVADDLICHISITIIFGLLWVEVDHIALSNLLLFFISADDLLHARLSEGSCALDV